MVPNADEHPAPPTRPFARLARGASGVLLLLTVGAVVLTMLVPPLLGYHEYAIRGGSMEPTIHRGALVYSEEVPVPSLVKGDVITYIPPGHSQAVTHRIIGISRPDPRLGPVFRTQGDANPKPDLRQFRLDKPTEARYVTSVPYIGWALIFLEIPLVRILALGVPALLVAFWIMASLWREGGRLLQEQQEDHDDGALEYEALYGSAGVSGDDALDGRAVTAGPR